MRKILLGVLAISNALHVPAQVPGAENKNVVISLAKQEFRFVKGNTANPVLIKEETSRSYFCNNYRTELPVGEFYSDIVRIDDVDILVDQSKKNGITPVYEFYHSSDIFYSDARVCHFSLPLVKKGSTSKVTIRKTILDPHYFTSIHFMESVPILEQQVKIYVPSWMKMDLKEFNFSRYNIRKVVSTEGDETVYTYIMKDIPALANEESSPGVTYYAPHLLIMTKSAETSDGTLTYFNTLKDQYNWYHKLVLEIGNDDKSVKEKAIEVSQAFNTEQEKVKAIFLWVQDNIRYIAFEDGIAGFKPEKGQEVLRKKYGDCKGMANLVTEMLRAIGLDARRCWIGTRHLAYNYSTPSLAVDNHMISAWMKNGKPLFLDATEKYIGMGELAERIQGREILIEDGANYILAKVPIETYLQNTAYEKRQLSVDGASLKGQVVQTWKGENKELLLSGLNSISHEKQETALTGYLSGGNSNFIISAVKVTNLTDYNKDLKVEYDILLKNVLTEFGDETYLEVDNRRSLENYKIDTALRKLPYWFYFKNHQVFETEISLPEGKKAGSLPTELIIQRPAYSFSGGYKVNGTKINYRCEIILHQSDIQPEQFVQWNKDIEQLKNFYNQQIVITKVK